MPPVGDTTSERNSSTVTHFIGPNAIPLHKNLVRRCKLLFLRRNFLENPARGSTRSIGLDRAELASP